MDYEVTAADLEKQAKANPHKGSKRMDKKERKREKEFRNMRRNARGRSWEDNT